MTHPDTTDTPSYLGEQTFVGSCDSVRYLIQDATTLNDTLVVGFSAQHQISKTPRYSSIKVLRDMPCHRLFILDDHGPVAPYARGSWYMGHNRRFTVEATVRELIDHVIAELGVARERVMSCGSSKGGWAAIYFAFAADLGHAIAGEPQSKIGTHLLGPGAGADTRSMAEFIAGGTEANDWQFLDDILFQIMSSSRARPILHLLIGRGVYEERHIAPLVEVATEIGVRLDVEQNDFVEHDDLAVHFPPYLRAKILSLARG